jgi:hypothetical protein
MDLTEAGSDEGTGQDLQAVPIGSRRDDGREVPAEKADRIFWLGKHRLEKRVVRRTGEIESFARTLIIVFHAGMLAADLVRRERRICYDETRTPRELGGGFQLSCISGRNWDQFGVGICGDSQISLIPGGDRILPKLALRFAAGIAAVDVGSLDAPNGSGSKRPRSINPNPSTSTYERLSRS